MKVESVVVSQALGKDTLEERRSRKRLLSVAISLVSVAFASRAGADGSYLCCSMASQESAGACTAHSAACTDSTSYGASLSNQGDAGVAAPPDAGITLSFPPGVDGYLTWAKNAPWLGLCLDAPSAKDPAHTGPAEPLGCLAVSLAPGVGAEQATFQIPMDPRWDGYQLCYGAKLTSGFLQYDADGGGAPCATVNDALDPTVGPTPVSGSCCGAVQPFKDLASSNQWSVTIAQELPGIPPPVVAYSPDGGIVALYQPDAGDTLGGLPEVCVSAYNESNGCGTPPRQEADAGKACVPTTCVAQNTTCGQISDGCGGTLHCATNCSPQAQACSVNGAMSSGANTASTCAWPLLALGLAGIRRARRKGAAAREVV